VRALRTAKGLAQDLYFSERGFFCIFQIAVNKSSCHSYNSIVWIFFLIIIEAQHGNFGILLVAVIWSQSLFPL